MRERERERKKKELGEYENSQMTTYTFFLFFFYFYPLIPVNVHRNIECLPPQGALVDILMHIFLSMVTRSWALSQALEPTTGMILEVTETER